MNKEKFIRELENITGLDNNKCTVINSILESHFLLGKNNKEKIINDIMLQLQMTNETAEKIYESAMSIIGIVIKDKLKHPFKSQDN